MAAKAGSQEHSRNLINSKGLDLSPMAVPKISDLENSF